MLLYEFFLFAAEAGDAVQCEVIATWISEFEFQ